jgi:hypothetical protein
MKGLMKGWTHPNYQRQDLIAAKRKLLLEFAPLIPKEASFPEGTQVISGKSLERVKRVLRKF